MCTPEVTRLSVVVAVGFPAFRAAPQQAVEVGGGSSATPVSPRRKRDLGRLPIAQRDPSRTQAKAARRALTTQAVAIHRDV